MKKVVLVPEEISQDEPTYRFDCSIENDTMLISFAVFPAPGGKSAFDFVRTVSPIKVKKLFLRDPNMMWYQKGSPGIGDDVPGVLTFLKTAITKERVRRVVTIGNSGGGYAAILFGVLLGADEIHAFNPVTLLRGPEDTSAPDQLELLKQERGLDIPYLDLRAVLDRHLQPGAKIYIHYSRGDNRDRRHAKYLRRFPNVRLYEYPFVTHHVARFFAERDMLTPLLHAAALGDGQQLEAITRRMVRIAAPRYIPARIVWFFGKVICRTRKLLGIRTPKG